MQNLPQIQQIMVLLQELQSEEYWQDITLPMLENVRRKLRNLVHLIEARKRKIIYTNFEDVISDGVVIDMPTSDNGVDRRSFRAKVEFFLQQHRDHITIQKLYRNEQLTAQDLAQLERIFIEEGNGTQDDLEKVRNEGGLGIFIRSLAGLDREAAKNAFAGFIEKHTFSANQLEFLDIIINQLTKSGIMEPARLYESPFTDKYEQGVSSLFSKHEVDEICELLSEMRNRAVA